MPHAYTEDQLVEQPAIGLFAPLDRSTVSALQNLQRTRGTVLPRPLSSKWNSTPKSHEQMDQTTA